jgi:hypothetical protein
MNDPNYYFAGPCAIFDSACAISANACPVKPDCFLMFRQLSDDHLVDEILAVRELSNEWKKRIEVMRERLRRGEPLSSNLV